MKPALLFVTTALLLAAPAAARDPLAPLPDKPKAAAKKKADAAPIRKKTTAAPAGNKAATAAGRTPDKPVAAPARRKPAETATRKPAAEPIRAAALPQETSDDGSYAAPPPPRPIVVPKSWREVFTAIRSGDWSGAQAGIVALPPGVLTPVAKAELYTARGSPVVSLDQLQALLLEAPEIPEAEQLARMAQTRGATDVRIVPRNRLIYLGSSPYRTRARAVGGEPAADELRARIDPLIKENQAAEAEALLVAAAPLLSPSARAEASQRIAWTYYVLGLDLDARRLADGGRAGVAGEWATHSAWVSGLAAWRMNDCDAAARAFREVAATSIERELRAAGHYWAARSEQACRRPRAVAPLLKAAATSADSFYGLIARETLGMDTRLPPDPHSAAAIVENLPNVRRAVELIAIGERALGEEYLRHQARIGRASEHHGLIEFAKKLDLAGAQYWLAHFGPQGAQADAADRYPVPRWVPARGWRIDPALALAHARQESSFRTEVVSPAGAVGLMQVRPGTAADHARAAGFAFSQGSLVDPAYNLEYGQGFIELMRRSSATNGQLPRIIAAYNAGPVPVSRWLNLYDRGDPLLWIESLTYWETRYYVPAVMRNLWVYQGLMGRPKDTLRSLAQHRWPAFPTGSPSQLSQAPGGASQGTP